MTESGQGRTARDGTSGGVPVAPGSYVVAVLVRGPFGETRHEVPVTVSL